MLKTNFLPLACLALALSLSAGLFGCDKLPGSGGKAGGSPTKGAPSRLAEAAEGWVKRSPLMAHIPATARTVVFARDLNQAGDALQFVAARTPLSGARALRERLGEALGFDPFDPAKLSQAGVDSGAPAALFYDRGYWVFAAQLKDRDRLKPALKAIESSGQRAPGAESSRPPGAQAEAEFQVERVDFDPMDLLRITASGDNLTWLAWSDSLILAAVRAEKTALNTHDKTLPRAWMAESGKARFSERDDIRKLFGQLSPRGGVVGVVRPAAWLADMESQGHARLLLQRLVGQVGPIGVAASSAALDKSLDLYILTPGNPRAPAMISSLGHADGEVKLPDGLIEPGVLGVARISVDPRQLYALFVSTLPAEQREETQKYWAALNRELRIDAERDVLENLGGHAVLVAYGLDPDALKEGAQASTSSGFLRAITLQSTREAVLLPIKEREPLELVLDALTTVSKGKLSRQVAGHTLQYAWLEDGNLKWALILSDESLIYVDSAVAFEHARAFERGERSAPGELKKLGITRLFSPRDAAGIYLDTASLGAILAETAAEGAKSPFVEWIRPFTSAVITTRQAADGTTGVTEMQLRMAPEATTQAKTERP